MKDLSEQTHYEVLELTPGCAADALLKAYALAKERYAPGSLATYALAEPGEAEALLRRVEEAFAVLSDPDRRQAYDAAGGYASVAWARAAERTLAPPAVAPEPERAPPPAVAPENRPVPEAKEPPAVAEPAPELRAAPEPAAAEPIATEPSAPARPVAAAPEPSAESHGEAVAQPIAEMAGKPAPELPAEPVAESPAQPTAEPLAEPTAEPLLEPMAAKVEQKTPEPEHKPVRKTESELPADSAVTGEALRRVREARGLTLKDVESRTKIGRSHLENIERERYADLPAQVYLRGFLMSLARELKLDPVRVARSYLEQMKAKPQPKSE